MKCATAHAVTTATSRSPCGERGLKCVAALEHTHRAVSLPLRGAWIEIVFKHVGKTACAIVEFKQDEATRTLCPVCGNVSDGIHLALVEEVTAEGEHLPYGELVLRMVETANGNTLLSVCFEVSGKLTQPKGEVKITMPAELLNGVTLALLNADDTEIDLPYIVEGENAVFTLDFTDAEIPTALIRLIPTAE